MDNEEKPVTITLTREEHQLLSFVLGVGCASGHVRISKETLALVNKIVGAGEGERDAEPI